MMVVTMKDVATYAGVSKSTVSQYLNKRYEYMSEETKQRVKQAIDALNYVPNQVARSLKQKKTNIVAVIVATLSSRFTTELINVLEQYFAEQQVDVLVASTEDDSKKERTYVDSLRAKQIDGIIVFPTSQNKAFYQELQQTGYPIVFIDRFIADVAIESVVLNNKEAGFLATKELIINGHTEIGILTFPLGENDSIINRSERLTGYITALNEAGLPINDKYIVQTNPASVTEQLDTLFSSSAKPTGLILTNDILLEKTLFWIKKKQLTLPDDLSIVSIDDISFAQIFTPAITTISQPIIEMGTTVATILNEKINKVKPTSNQLLFSFMPVINKRESVKKIEKRLHF